MQCQDRLRQLELPELASRLKVGWNKRLRSTAGRAWIRESWIELNPLLVEHGVDQVRLTLLHELAHLVAYERHGRHIQAHGSEWRQACADLGIAGASATASSSKFPETPILLSLSGLWGGNEACPANEA